MMLATRTNNGLDLVRDFDSLLESFLDDRPMKNGKYPLVDIREEEDRYQMEAEIPGFNEEDIQINVNDGILTLSSEMKKEEERKDKGYLVRERRCSTFQRSFVLPKNADAEGISASYKDGILELEIPKRAEAKPRAIKINRKK